MAEFAFTRHHRYPGADLQISINPTITGGQTVAKVMLFAEGDADSRSTLIEDMKAWADRHRLGPYKCITSKGCCGFDIDLKGWAVVADFIVTWIGVELLSVTIEERQFLERRIFGEVRALTHQVEALTSKISRLEATMGR